MASELIHYGVIGMKWGVRRYQNKDGTLTKAGEKRYARDVRENKAKKKDNRIDVSEPDPKRWVTEDLQRSKAVTDSSATLIKQGKQIEEATRKKRDLSDMSDQELRAKINRKMLERQYEDLFKDEQTLSRGRKATRAVLDNADFVLGTTSSALAIALAIKKLKE